MICTSDHHNCLSRMCHWCSFIRFVQSHLRHEPTSPGGPAVGVTTWAFLPCFVHRPCCNVSQRGPSQSSDDEVEIFLPVEQVFSRSKQLLVLTQINWSTQKPIINRQHIDSGLVSPHVAVASRCCPTSKNCSRRIVTRCREILGAMPCWFLWIWLVGWLAG